MAVAAAQARLCHVHLGKSERRKAGLPRQESAAALWGRGATARPEGVACVEAYRRPTDRRRCWQRRTACTAAAGSTLEQRGYGRGVRLGGQIIG